MTLVYSVTPIARPLDATVRLPGSKSITNRALLAAALAAGRSRLDGALFADDTAAMMRCLARLGAVVSADADAPAAAVTLDGVAGRLGPGPVDLDAGQAGTTARFLLPVLAAGSGPYVLDGDAQLRRRPMGPGLRALRSMGVAVEERGMPGRLPVLVHGGPQASSVAVSGDVSSQFVSGLLLAAPLFPQGLAIELTTELVSRPYVAMTSAVMAAFGIDVEAGAKRFTVRPGEYKATTYRIEPDASAASYFLAAAAVCGGRVTVPGLGRDSLQGDVAFADLLERMGAGVTWASEGVTVRGPAGGRLHGIEADLSDVSDLAPTLAVVAAFAGSPTRATGVGFIRAKETDRIATIVRELRRCGVEAEEEPGGFVVRPRPGAPAAAVVEPDGDHRMAMAFAIIGLRVPGISIAEPDCVAKTFPGFWTTLEGLGQIGS